MVAGVYYLIALMAALARLRLREPLARGTPPVSILKPVREVNAPTPTRIPGATVLKTRQLYDALKGGKLVGSEFVVVDASSEPTHPSIPAANRLPQAGQGGALDPKLQREVWTALDKMSGGKFTKPIVFFSRDAKNWEGYNAALRAIEMGYSSVYWYRGGIAAWKAANQPLN